MKKLILITFGILIAGVVIGQDVRMYGGGTEESIPVRSDSYDSGTGSDNVTELNPDYAHRTTTEHFVDTANCVANDEHWSSVIYGDTYKDFALQLQGSSGGSGITFKVYVTNNSDAAVPAQGAAISSDWADVSTDILGAATLVLDAGATSFKMINNYVFDRMIVFYQADNATNTADAWFKKAN